MKNTFKILSLCVVMIFALSFSAFGGTNNEKKGSFKLQNSKGVKVGKNLIETNKSLQLLKINKVELRNLQSNFNLTKAMCLRLVKLGAFSDACTIATAAAGVAVATAAVTCLTGVFVACALASAAAAVAVAAMKEACKKVVAFEESEASIDRKLLKLRNNKFQFQTNKFQFQT